MSRIGAALFLILALYGEPNDAMINAICALAGAVMAVSYECAAIRAGR